MCFVYTCSQKAGQKMASVLIVQFLLFFYCHYHYFHVPCVFFFHFFFIQYIPPQLKNIHVYYYFIFYIFIFYFTHRTIYGPPQKAVKLVLLKLMIQTSLTLASILLQLYIFVREHFKINNNKKLISCNELLARADYRT